ncbi:hypothetical protein [Mucilaginibacter gotjawali]|uniref:Uncharacterized protein involved in copper resistance n=2 Tax=Mucilaginibacter gotjawali TaxID=1550579 RepID=A0A839SMM3_9SPHI|nr:hypothetical protein [Mucilaginibacter gotjawali]MBB3058822.1 uncharacterized protein involved in copper resistance [Mucilaginibacter gotjawali]BAU52209.1 hypothetical protein MgSA37_00359 [Mucilaginibacter gotjawali]
MKSIFSGAVIAAAVIASLTLNVQAKSFNHASAPALSDTGKMAKDKMKMDKMETKKSGKMAKSKMKADKKMDKMNSGKMKMAKDSSGKM